MSDEWKKLLQRVEESLDIEPKPGAEPNQGGKPEHLRGLVSPFDRLGSDEDVDDDPQTDVRDKWQEQMEDLETRILFEALAEEAIAEEQAQIIEFRWELQAYFAGIDTEGSEYIEFLLNAPDEELFSYDFELMEAVSALSTPCKHGGWWVN